MKKPTRKIILGPTTWDLAPGNPIEDIQRAIARMRSCTPDEIVHAAAEGDDSRSVAAYSGPAK